jgi:hypothetical protein
LGVEGKENNLLRIMVFAGVLFIVSFSGFTSIMGILKNVYELHDNPRHYSLVTICLTCMWDAALCVIAFVYAFSDQESLMLFIMPAFLLCLLFTNLQPRLMILIYQQSTNSTLREIICRFNLFHYGTLLLVYPLLLLTNLAAPLFLFMSCLYFPQIYTNGLGGVRPEYTSPYYTRYLLTRMLIIVRTPAFSSTCAASPSTSSTSSPTTSSPPSVSSSSQSKYPLSHLVCPALRTETVRGEGGDAKIPAGAGVRLQVRGGECGGGIGTRVLDLPDEFGQSAAARPQLARLLAPL